MFDCVRAHCTN